MATEQVKVFKNVHTQTPTYGSAFEVVLAQTSSTQKAVIKEVNCKAVGVATLDHDGRTVATTTTQAADMIASGSLIMDVSSVLKLKFGAKATPTTASFKAMVFCDSTDGITFVEGTGAQSATGTDTTATTATNLTTSSTNTHSAFAAIKPGDTEVTYFRYYSNTIYEYVYNSSSAQTSYSFGSGHGSCTDGTYMYNIPSGSGTTINRRHLTTGVNSNFSSASTVHGQQSNQGSFLLHHNGYLYTKQEGNSGNMSVIKISDGSVTTISNGAVGSYSDGAAIVTTLAGTSYVVEQGTDRWQWYEIGGSATQFTHETGTSSGSTEYGQGGFEIAPGIAMILCESNDDLSIIDMNTSPPQWSHISSPSTRNILNHDAIGSYFAVAHYLTRDSDAEIYDAYTSGVLIEGV
tara:strand:+ start:17820 stop:19034 length:1215 start_codon:yes stop_codon:yes gene_type:complete